MSSSSADAGDRKRQLAAIQGILAVSMLMADADDPARIFALASSAIETVPGGRLLGVLGEDGQWIDPATPPAVADLMLASVGRSPVPDAVSVRGGEAATLIPLRTHRARLGYLVVPAESVTGFGAFLLQTLAHETAVALAVCWGREALREQAHQIAQSEARYRDLADRSPDAIWHLSFDPFALDYVSPSFERITGLAPSRFGGDAAAFVAVIDPAGDSRLRQVVAGSQPVAALRPERFFSTVSRPDGTTVVLETQVAVVPNGVQGIARDMTEVGRLQAELTERALRDPLTGLANRNLLDEQLAAALRRAQRSGGTVRVAFVDLDGFKAVNDTYGHPAGDTVLRVTAERLRRAVRGSDSVGRMGGDEFVLVVENAEGSAEELVDRVGRALSEPIDIGGGRHVRCPASIGVADSDAAAGEPEGLLAAADAAMYERKRASHAEHRGRRVNGP